MRPSAPRIARLSLLVGLASVAAFAVPVGAAPGAATTIAVIGDTPYGADQTSPTAFPNLVASIDADPNATLALHLGDIKNGSTLCSDAYFARVRGQFDLFDDPLVFTPGDNDWTDCHRANNGSFVPTERLARLRSVFFPTAGQTIGGSRQVTSQGGSTPENVRFEDSGVVFSIIHVVGSNNGRLPWFTQVGQTPETPAQTMERNAEVDSRTAAAVAWIDVAFDRAAAIGAPGVVLGMQADMFDAGPVDGFNPIVQRIADRSATFAKPVLLLEGDSHRYTVDRPLVAGSPRHGVTTAAPNLTRIVVEGEQTREWLRLVVDPRSSAVFSFQRVAVGGPVPVVPEAPVAILLPLLALAGGAVLVIGRRRPEVDATA